jgi:molybdate transport system substrate-binding protein
MKRLMGLTACVVVAALLAGCGRKADRILVYCGGSMRLPMEEIVKLYNDNEKNETKAMMESEDSGTLMTRAQETGRGDVLIVHDPFGAMAENRGLASETAKVAVLMPGIAVKRGTPAEEKVKDLADLALPGLKIGAPDYEYASCGVVLKAMLEKTDFKDAFDRNVKVRSRSSSDLINALTVAGESGRLDAVVAWDALIRRDASLKLIPIAKSYEVEAVTSATGKTYPARRVYVTVSTLKSSTAPEAAKALMELAAGPEGQAIWKKYGFEPAGVAKAE